MADLEAEIKKIIEDVKKLLEENKEWKGRYKTYATVIKENEKIIKANKKKYHQPKQFGYYMPISLAIAKKIPISLRFNGDKIATLEINEKGVFISVKLDENHKKYGWKKAFETSWHSQDALLFRKHFEGRKGEIKVKESQPERKIESWLLKNLDSKKKLIPYIKPIKMAGIYDFQFPTPISASGKKTVYRGSKGGGIDILARYGKGSQHLAVIELKDEDNDTEPVERVLKQATAYAVFLQQLLRSTVGETWYGILGFSGKIPKSLKIYVISLMPCDKGGKAKEYKYGDNDKGFPIDDDKLFLESWYFKEDGGKIVGIERP